MKMSLLDEVTKADANDACLAVKAGELNANAVSPKLFEIRE